MSGTRPAPRQRVFVALVPALRERRALAAAAGALPHRGRAVPAQNLHMTLAFLGSLEAPAVAAACQALSGIAGESFELAFTRIGHFPRPRVLWAAAPGAPGTLYAVQGAVQAALRGAGIGLDTRAFSPHVTVARDVGRYRGPAALPHPVHWQLEAIKLVASRTLPQGARYRVLRSVGLRAPG